MSPMSLAALHPPTPTPSNACTKKDCTVLLHSQRPSSPSDPQSKSTVLEDEDEDVREKRMSGLLNTATVHTANKLSSTAKSTRLLALVAVFTAQSATSSWKMSSMQNDLRQVIREREVC